MNAKPVLLAVSALGLIVFAAVFAITFSNPKLIAHSAKYFVVEKVKADYAEHRSKIKDDSTAGKVLNSLKEKYREKLDKIPEDLARLDDRISTYIDAMCSSDTCDLEELQSNKDLLQTIYEHSAKRDFGTALETIDALVRNKTREIISKLITDLRIFSGTNVVIYALIFSVIALAGPGLIKPMTLPAVLLTVTSVIAIFIYVFEQNWFFTIMYSDYWGTGYIILVSVIFLFLIDIFMNRARITNLVIQFVGEVVASIASKLSI
jgi:hypothetical protein